MIFNHAVDDAGVNVCKLKECDPGYMSAVDDTGLDYCKVRAKLN